MVAWSGGRLAASASEGVGAWLSDLSFSASGVCKGVSRMDAMVRYVCVVERDQSQCIYREQFSTERYLVSTLRGLDTGYITAAATAIDRVTCLRFDTIMARYSSASRQCRARNVRFAAKRSRTDIAIRSLLDRGMRSQVQFMQSFESARRVSPKGLVRP